MSTASELATLRVQIDSKSSQGNVMTVEAYLQPGEESIIAAYVVSCITARI